MPLAAPKDTSTASATSASNAATNNARRQFSFWGSNRGRFQMPRGRLLDICLDGCQTLMESAVYILGPFLILLALSITALLSYTFFHILVPMMMEKHAAKSTSWQVFVVAAHCVMVVFLLVNILFNYAMCVMTRNDGPAYDRVVRELATVTGFVFPETPAQTLEYRRDFEDRMVRRIKSVATTFLTKHVDLVIALVLPLTTLLFTCFVLCHQQVIRMRRRRAREEAVEQQQEQKAQGEAVNNESSSQAVVPNEEGGQGTVTQRRGGDNANKKAIKNAVQASSSTVVRRWMLMGPFEWGFCANSMQPKPPRSHYDHVTKKLVLNLDVSV